MRKRGIRSVLSTALPEWRELERFPGYRFCCDGTVWSCWRQFGLGMGNGSIKRMTEDWFQMKLSPGGNGKYFKVCMRGDWIDVHVVILLAFRGPRPEGQWARHLDGDSRNNHIDNLKWDTKSSNMHDKIDHGTNNDGERNPFAKLKTEQVLKIRSMSNIGIGKLAAMFNVTRGNIAFILTRKTWRHV